PEVAQHLLVVELAGGDAVELLLEVSGEAELDVAREEALEKGRHQAAAILGDQLPLLQPDVVPVLQHGDGGSIGRGPADTQLLHLLDQASFAEARRRLGEMLLYLRLFEPRMIADFQRGQLAAVEILGVVLAVLLGLDAIEREETGK